MASYISAAMLNDTVVQRYMLSASLLEFYLSALSIALVLCFIAFIAMTRTRKVPYSSKLLSLGLLFFDILFLILAGVTKLFDSEGSIYLKNVSRGFQVASQLIVLFMALERFFVLNWPYVYLRVATTGRIRMVCLVICILSFLQFVGVRIIICYNSYITKTFYCGSRMAIYMMVLSFAGLFISFISYFQIYTIVIRKKIIQGHRYSIKQYKGTVTSFVYLINTTITQVINSGILIYLVMNKSIEDRGYYGAIGDIAFIFNCIVDPLIYVVWFKETRYEILNMLKVVCPCLNPATERMRMELFNIVYMRNNM